MKQERVATMNARHRHRWIASVATVCALLTLGACQTTAPFVWVDDIDASVEAPLPYRIRAGDEVMVQVWKQDQLSTTVRVRADGRITLVLVGDVAIAGLKPEAAAKQIALKLDGLFVDPRVTVAVVRTLPESFSVLGEVKTAGKFPLEPGDTVLHGVARAGGLTDFADRDSLYVIRQEPVLTRVRFTWADLVGGEGRAPRFLLRGGDVVIVE